jgi:glucose-6-phosphate 1-dehydrogenase
VTPRADAFVFFGATGDLARKMIFPALYRLVKTKRLDIPVIGMAFSGWDVTRLRQRVAESVAAHGGIEDRDALEALLSRVRYVDGDYNDPKTFDALRTALGDARCPVGDEPDLETPYERLLGASLEGTSSLFVRQDTVEACWRIVAGVLTEHPPALPYEPGTWGPPHAAAIVD